MEVHAAGGGINYTVTHTRNATEAQLKDLLESRLDMMLQSGTTLAECKSGYGLDTKTELKMLRTLEKVSSPVEISSTFCGAHSVPEGMTMEQATRDVIENQLPAVKAAKDAGELPSLDNIDVFCETGVFEVESTKSILEKGMEMGLAVNFHAEELSYLGGVEMGASIKAKAISHLEKISDAGIEAMARSGSVAVILPTTAYILRLENPPVRRMIEKGVIVALGSDFNPNAYCVSLPIVMHLACVLQRMSLEEALAAATINAAHSIGRSSTHGSIEKGKVADLVVINAPRWENLVYQLGNHGNVIDKVIKRGRTVVNNKKPT